MWRTQSSAEKWERKKTYLIRSLFQDEPFLSPIQEEPAEPDSSSSDDEFRAASPLPDLIIEVEPRKPNLHDESEEFYECLAKEMRYLYKRDHYIDSSTASSSSLKSFEENEYEQRISTPFKYRSSDFEDIDDISSIREPEAQRQSELRLSNQTTYRNSNEVEFESNSRKSRRSGGTASGDNSYLEPITQAEVPSHVENDNVNSGEEFQSLAETCDASKRNTTSSELSSHFSSELMRRVQDLASFGSLPRYEPSEADSENVIGENDLSIEVQPMELAEDTIFYGCRETHEASSDLSNLLSTSTPVSKQKSQIVRKKFRRRLDPYSAHSSTSRRDVGCVDANTQTSFSDDEPDWGTFWNNFFVGNPSVYTLCSCRNHVCS